MEASPFEQLLKQAMGLDAASIGAAAVERAVQERISACALPDATAYLERLRESATELQELIEAVVVPETWFFRDPGSFTALAHLACDNAWHRRTDPVMRLLSMPCSTGEEPFSMAMALLDAGVEESRLTIDAVDISNRALARAGLALYGRNSFRGGDMAFRDRHFVATAGGYRLSEAIRRKVHFRRGNLFGHPAPGAEFYDIVFCRNVLIYFDRATQDRAIAILGRLLKPDGWLFVGPSEAALLSTQGFASAKLPLAFAFRKGSAAAGVAPLRATASPPMARRPSAPPVVLARRAVQPRRTSAAAVPQVATRDEDAADIDRARRLADQGHLAEAAALCESHLRERGPSADLLCLLGVIRDASGNMDDAVDQYRKALYLAPNHHEALVHLALLLRMRGDTAGAQRLQWRADRLRQDSEA